MSFVLIVDDHPMTCFGLELLVKQVIKDSDVGFAHTFDDAMEEMRMKTPMLTILDLGIPGGQGPQMIRLLREIQPNCRILICSGRDELINAPSYIQFGANGFLNKNVSDSEIKRAIQTVMDNKNYLSEEVQKKVMSNLLNNTKPVFNPLDSLSPRERQVLQLLMEGKWIKEVASELNLKFSTISTQKAKIFQKMDVDNMVDLVRKVEMLSNN